MAEILNDAQVEDNSEAEPEKMVPPSLPESLPAFDQYYIGINDNNIVATFTVSNTAQSNIGGLTQIKVEKDIYDTLESDISKKYKWINNELVEYTPPVIKTYPPISDSQFFGQLALDGIITEEEALATSDGTMPALLMGILDQIPDPKQKFMAIMRVKNTTVFEIDNPIVEVVRQALNQIYPNQWPQARIQQLWEEASTI